MALALDNLEFLWRVRLEELTMNASGEWTDTPGLRVANECTATCNAFVVYVDGVEKPFYWSRDIGIARQKCAAWIAGYLAEQRGQAAANKPLPCARCQRKPRQTKSYCQDCWRTIQRDYMRERRQKGIA